MKLLRIPKVFASLNIRVVHVSVLMTLDVRRILVEAIIDYGFVVVFWYSEYTKRLYAHLN